MQACGLCDDGEVDDGEVDDGKDRRRRVLGKELKSFWQRTEELGSGRGGY
jgi:hypothetical protein